MNEREIIQLLKNHKDTAELGGGFDSGKAWSRFASEYGFDEKPAAASYSFSEYMEYVGWYVSHQVVKPVALGFAVMLLVFGTSVSLVSASMQSLPGDRLYPAKLGLERAQLALARSASDRAKLQVEFTGRRLEEMVELAFSNRIDRTQEVQKAMTRFKDNVSTIKQELTEVPQSTELAKAVGRKVEAYKTSVAAVNTPEVSEEVSNQAQEVQEIINDTQEQAVEVIITTHETVQDEDTVRELTLSFDQEVANLKSEYLALDTASQKLIDFEEKLALANELKTNGLWRRAFQVLKEVQLNFPLTK